MKCPYCGSEDIVKAGKRYNKLYNQTDIQKLWDSDKIDYCI